MGKIACSFYPSLVIILGILGTSFAAMEVTLNDIFIYVLQNSLGDEIKRNKLRGALARLGEGDGVYTGFWCRYLREKDHLEDLS